MKKQAVIFLIVCLSTTRIFAQSWEECTATLLDGLIQDGFVGGTGGVKANRLNGDVYIGAIDNGIWKSSDQCTTWTRIDDNTVSGRLETSWSMDQDQANPTRMAVFSLDGDAGFSPDGITWKKMTTMGRNWDYGSVDWTVDDPQTIFALKHEDGGDLHVSRDGGQTWDAALNLGFGANPSDDGMVGVINATTIIYSNGSNGINLSTDYGGSWNQVSTLNPKSRIPVYFNEAFYLASSDGLIVSRDNGQTWEKQGASVDIAQGPFFGSDENTMVVIGISGVYHSTNAGTDWTMLSEVCPDFIGGSTGHLSEAARWAQYAWDPVNNNAYATAMGSPGMIINYGPPVAISFGHRNRLTDKYVQKKYRIDGKMLNLNKIPKGFIFYHALSRTVH
jgi:hypothetical protein